MVGPRKFSKRGLVYFIMRIVQVLLFFYFDDYITQLHNYPNISPPPLRLPSLAHAEPYSDDFVVFRD